ncbi:MAG TPA: ABC transporter permease [Nonomuraea sp.]|nr:ABC transporter permease [Nonomuraea sp.]
MSNTLGNTYAAELIKLRTLPGALLAIAATALAAVLLAAAFTATAVSAESANGAAIAVIDVVRPSIGYLQIGFMVLGILTAATEYSPGQIRTTLTSVPNRWLLFAGKTIAYLTVGTLAAAITVAAGIATAFLALGEERASWGGATTAENVRVLLAAAAYLLTVGLFAYAVALLTRTLIATLVAMLALALIISPYLSAVSTLARYLPDAAGKRMFSNGPLTDGHLTPVQGAAVLAAWLVTALAGAALALRKRDA